MKTKFLALLAVSASLPMLAMAADPTGGKTSGGTAASSPSPTPASGSVTTGTNTTTDGGTSPSKAGSSNPSGSTR